MKNSYKIGRNAEYAVLRILKRKGFNYTIRSAGSHGPIDLLVSNGLEILAIQVKKNGYISEKELKRLKEWEKAFKAKTMIARKHKRNCVFLAFSFYDFSCKNNSLGL
jgi:Holliday junction resolvase